VRGSQAALCIAVLACVAPAAGCGEDNKASKPASLTVTVTEPSKGRPAYRAPSSVRAGLVRITLVNRGGRRHKAQLFRVDGSHSIAEARRVRTPFPRWFRWEGGVGVTEPGEKASITQTLHPGKYYITGNRGEEARVAPLRVVGARGGEKLPQAAGTVVFREYNFSARDLEAGSRSIEFRNEGLEPHHAVFAPVKRGASVRQLRRFLRGSGPIPVGEGVDLHGALETAVIEGGQSQVARLRLAPGKYALLCFVSDRRGGPAHVAKGMIDEVTVR
jgi:hypothetical protein